MKQLFEKILLLLFPVQCFICKKKGETIYDSLCLSCLTDFEKTIDTPYTWITSMYSYKDARMKKIIHAIKFFHRKDLLYPLAQFTAKQLTIHYKINNQNPIKENCVLVPIPSPTVRHYIRGYNQAEFFADLLGKELSIPVKKDLLTRKKSPKRQAVTKNRKERLSNQKNSMEAKGEAEDVSVILIDDVTTTGATLLEAKSVLIKSGWRVCGAITIAH